MPLPDGRTPTRAREIQTLGNPFQEVAFRAWGWERLYMAYAWWKTRSMFDRYNIVDERNIQEARKKLARHLAKQECLVKEGTGDWSAK